MIDLNSFSPHKMPMNPCAELYASESRNKEKRATLPKEGKADRFSRKTGVAWTRV